MRTCNFKIICSLLAVLIFATSASAQQSQPSWSPLRVAKWSTLTIATAAVVYGFTQNRRADREYADIERVCQDIPNRCIRQADSDAFADQALESRYQTVVRRDQRARVALLAGQLGLAASVVLFVLDLPGSSSPPGIPYNPKPLRLSVDRSAVRIGWVVAVR